MRTKKAKLLNRFDQLRKDTLEATTVNRQESKSEQQKRIKDLLLDYEAFCAYYFPHYATAKPAKFHKDFVNYVAKNKKCFVAIEWARDHAKSVTACLMLPIFLLAKKEIKTVIFVSKSQDAAIKLVEPLRANLESNQRFIHDFGDLKNVGNWDEDDFTTTSGTNFIALGRGQSPRGKRNKQHRPDMIVVDDIDDDELVENPSRVDKVWQWLMTALFAAMSIKGGRFIAVQNRYADNSIISRCVEKAKEMGKLGYHRKVNILDKNNKPSWKERFTLEDCQFMIKALGYIFSQREYFNNPISAGKIFQAEHLQDKRMTHIRNYPVLVSYNDPSFSDTKHSDSKAVILMGKKGTEYHILKAYCDQGSVNQMIEWHYALKDWVELKSGAVSFYMEDVFYQSLLYKDFKEYAQKNKLPPLGIIGDKRKKPKKVQRIMALAGLFERGNIYFNEAEKDNHHMKNLKEQFLAFDPSKKTMVDGPDAVEGAIYILDKLMQIIGDDAIKVGKRHRSSAKHY